MRGRPGTWPPLGEGEGHFVASFYLGRFLGREESFVENVGKRRECREKREYEDRGPPTIIPMACSACPP